MNVYLLDTNVVLHLVRGKALGQYIQNKYKLIDQPVRPLISIVSHGEIWVLAEQNNWAKEKREILQKTLDCLTTVDIHDKEIIAAYVKMDVASQNYHKGSINMGKNDLWIAACTRITGATLLTTDKDFDHLYPEYIQRIWIDPQMKETSL